MCSRPTRLRPAATVLALEPVAPAPKPAVKAAADDPTESLCRSPARYLWATRLARIYETLPLTCPGCRAEMRIIAFITASVDVRLILEHIGEPATPPRIASARGPLEWYEGSSEDSIDAETFILGNALAHPKPEYERPTGDLVAARRGLPDGLLPFARTLPLSPSLPIESHASNTPHGRPISACRSHSRGIRKGGHPLTAPRLELIRRRRQLDFLSFVGRRRFLAPRTGAYYARALGAATTSHLVRWSLDQCSPSTRHPGAHQCRLMDNLGETKIVLSIRATCPKLKK